MANLSTELSLGDLPSADLTSGELERFIQQNFGMGEEPQPAPEINDQAVITRPHQSPMLSSAALTQPTPKPLRHIQPYIEIVEQPQARGLRFRYECEGRSAGSIPGEHSTAEKKTYPTIRIRNHKGPAIIVVSCVTKDQPPDCKPHPHSLVGKDCKKGVCTVKLRDTDTIAFPHLGIQCAKKKDVEACLKLRKEINVDPFQTGFNSGQIDLNVVRLCFQVFLPDSNGKITRVVDPVVTHVIHDKKSVNDLTICRVDRTSGKAKGGDEIFLLCEKVNKDDIQIRFFQETSNSVTWEDFGDFGLGDVHRQFAIVFKTPPFKDPLIQHPAEVSLQLRRPSDRETSEPIPFTYMPEDPDPDRIEEKRKRKSATFIQSWGGERAQNTNVKEGLRTKLKANRRIKTEGEPMIQDELPRYSLNNTGASVAVGAHISSPTVTYITTDNTAMGNMTVINPGNSSVEQFIQGFDAQGNPIENPSVPEQQLEGINLNTIDQALLEAYLMQDSMQTDDALSENILDQSYPQNIAAIENVSSNVTVQPHPGTFAATQESIQALNSTSS